MISYNHSCINSKTTGFIFQKFSIEAFYDFTSPYWQNVFKEVMFFTRVSEKYRIPAHISNPHVIYCGETSESRDPLTVNNDDNPAVRSSSPRARWWMTGIGHLGIMVPLELTYGQAWRVEERIVIVDSQVLVIKHLNKSLLVLQTKSLC